jgi:uncharacterized protein YccT (UPF0319 family)
MSISHTFGAELVVPDVYKLIKVNGKAASSNFFSSETIVELRRGENVLLVQFSELFENIEDDDHITVKSEPQVVLFNLKENSIEKYFIIAPLLFDGIEARKFAESPTIEIAYIDKKSGQKKSIPTLNENLTEFKAGLALKKMAKNNLQPIDITDEKNMSKDKLSGNALDHLKLWWKKADKAEQKLFIEFIKP